MNAKRYYHRYLLQHPKGRAVSGLSLCAAESKVSSFSVQSPLRRVRKSNVRDTAAPVHAGHGLRAIQKGQKEQHYNFEKLYFLVSKRVV